jgi:hypothetical protein
MSDFIDLNEASVMTRTFRGIKEQILGIGYQGLEILPFCETFDAGQVQDMLSNNGCIGLRVYYGMDSNKKIHAILVGVDNEGKDILPEDDNAGNFILERGERNPPTPPPTSPLNS